MSYEITVFRDNKAKLHFEFNIDGAQTMERLKGDAQPDGDKIRLYVKAFGEDDSTGKIKYKVGILLLTLEKSTVGGKTRVLTHWGAFKPISKANQISGRVYFKPIVGAG